MSDLINRSEFRRTQHHILTFGRTGCGKSWTCNRLIAPGQSVFKEDDADESCTTVISTLVAFNGDLMSDVPGYFDSEGRDAIQQANFVDFLKGKSIRAVVFIYTDRADAFMASAVQAFKQSQLASNIIFVKNKLLKPAAVEVDTYDGLTKISVQANQTSLDVLKHHIATMQPVTVTELVTPVSLFKQPLEVTGSEMREEFVETRAIPTKVQLSRTVQVPVIKQKWKGSLGKITGSKESYTVYEPRTESYEEMVNKPFQVYNKFRVVFAKRFDGVSDIYEKAMVEIVTKEVV
jgi:hypothetical protein